MLILLVFLLSRI